MFFLLQFKPTNGLDSLTVHNETYYTGFSPLDSLNSFANLTKSIDNVLVKHSKYLNKTNYGIAVYSINQDKWYYRNKSKSLLTPASTTKLFTTYCILRQTETNPYVSTAVYHDGSISLDGVLTGNLYIRGGGDAMFSTSDLEELADKVKKAGIKKIKGKIIADGTFYDEKTERIVYSGDRDVVQATPPITSLNIDRNTATIIVSAGKGAQAPSVYVTPSSDSYTIINNAKIRNTAGKSSKRRKGRGSYRIDDEIINDISPNEEFRYGDFALAAAGQRSKIRITTKLLSDGKQQFVVSGTINSNSTYTYRHLILNPPLTIAGAFKSRLKAGGITVNEDIDVLSREKGDSLVNIYKFVCDFKRPLNDIINIVNKESDNYLAEILFKMIGANSGAYHDNAPASRKIIDSIINVDGIECDECKLNDGSGLSRRNLTSVEALVGLLVSAGKFSFYETYKNSMSLASVDGTLKKRFKSTAAESNLRGKTGTLRNVSALAGYVDTMDGEELAFAFVFNGPNIGVYKQIENELGQILSEYYIQEVTPEMWNK
ncbi:MAG: D-alanyl-D-alanine carboxypeptidase/D-alanyl-D-alanine-endopeptidase [Candidatus Kapabacteria bacterium]|nr:D-alanyl-D-alanine carboxypeptidase/D-alanyl-D-alanine-endopeptidase [Candidatus Kapabacteria bacterium]